jgi:hypothetical protein
MGVFIILAGSYNAAERKVPMAEAVEKIKVVQRHSFAGCAWITSWLFTIGFLHLGFWRGVAAVVIWPYYIGVTVSALVH